MTDLTHIPPVVTNKLPEDLKPAIVFHGHLCPGLVYGYLVAKEAIRLLHVHRAQDEEVVAICESDSCAIDALQYLLGTTKGKGNLIIRDYGKSVFTILNRSANKAFRFSRKKDYTYEGKHPEEFAELERAMKLGNITTENRQRQKWLKALDLLSKSFSKVYNVKEVITPQIPYAPLAQSMACSECGEMAMETKMLTIKGKGNLCAPCAEKIDNKQLS